MNREEAIKVLDLALGFLGYQAEEDTETMTKCKEYVLRELKLKDPTLTDAIAFNHKTSETIKKLEEETWDMIKALLPKEGIGIPLEFERCWVSVGTGNDVWVKSVWKNKEDIILMEDSNGDTLFAKRTDVCPTDLLDAIIHTKVMEIKGE